MSIQIVSIEGNIGSGKSTLLENLKQHFSDNTNVIFLKEPVDEWSKIMDENGVTILEKFYNDQSKYGFSFQIMAYISRLKLLKEAIQQLKTANSNESFVIITERSLYTDKNVFAKMLYDGGKIEEINFQIYLNWFHTFAEDYSINKIIYVKTSPEKCHERINKRNRVGEIGIPFDYLKLCGDYHDDMLDTSVESCFCKTQLVLDGNVDIYKNGHIVNEQLQEISRFIS